jgi:hypothetical protein
LHSKSHEICNLSLQQVGGKFGSNFDQNFIECLCIIAKVINFNFSIHYPEDQKLKTIDFDINTEKNDRLDLLVAGGMVFLIPII